MDAQKSMLRVQKSMQLDQDYMAAMMAVSQGKKNPELFNTFALLEKEYRLLLDETEPDEMLLTRQMLLEKIADVTDWHARLLENSMRYREAMEYFKKAAELYENAGRPDLVKKCREKYVNLKNETEQDYDSGKERLLSLLEKAGPYSPEKAKILVTLGEYESSYLYDSEAVKWLDEAEKVIAKLGGIPDDAATLGEVFKTVQNIHTGTQKNEPTAIENAILLRALAKRLLMAYSNIYRSIDPDKAAEYEEQLAQITGDAREEEYIDKMIKQLKKNGYELSQSAKEILGQKKENQ
ncbi:hypothetical protein JW935_02995 [candidate division KSB1 bacterium]|nr:hypothetical protein [candidate division KSB1 bacterium]